MSTSPTDTDDVKAFAASRPKLWSVAYRMLGSRADVEDVLQDAYLRWHAARTEDVRTPEAWLVTTVTRLSIDRLRQLRAERERYTGPWLPEPLVGDAPAEADASAELASELSVALLTMLERLGPEERAAFVLRETFDWSYGEIAKALNKSEAACRQIVSRATKRLRAPEPKRSVTKSVHRRLLDGLLRALETCDQDAMLELLAADATWTADSGGKVQAAGEPILGAARIAEFITGVATARRFVFRSVAVNDEPGIAVLEQDRLVSIVAIRTDGDRILDVYSIMNPDKLAGVRIAAR